MIYFVRPLYPGKGSKVIRGIEAASIEELRTIEKAPLIVGMFNGDESALVAMQCALSEHTPYNAVMYDFYDCPEVMRTIAELTRRQVYDQMNR